MQYLLERINTMASCDALLVFAQQKKSGLERKRRNLGEAIEALRERVDVISKEYIQVQLLVKAYATAYHALPDGSKDKVSLNVDLKQLELRQAVLEKKAFTCNVRTLLAKEVHYNKVDHQVLALESFVMAVQHRKTELGRVRPVAAPSRPPSARQKPQPAKRLKQLLFSSPKQPPQKNVYKFPVHFSGRRDCTFQKYVRFSSA